MFITLKKKSEKGSIRCKKGGRENRVIICEKPKQTLTINDISVGGWW